jgi:hypothetical protein
VIVEKSDVVVLMLILFMLVLMLANWLVKGGKE